MGKVIAIDINDVIRDNSDQILKVYKKFINSDCNLTTDDLVNFNENGVLDFFDNLQFEDVEEYKEFKYNDYVYEIFGRAEPTNKFLPYRLSDWLQNTLRDFEEDKIPEIIFFSPYEISLSIQATLSFLSRIGCRARHIEFPINSNIIWEKSDIVITANPNLINNKPDNKIVFKIKKPYNINIKCDYEYDNLIDIILDEEEKINKIIDE